MGEFEVIISRGYWLGVYPVTQCQWESVMGTNPSRFKGPNQPVAEVGWQDALDFCNRLNGSQIPIPKGYTFSLPTQAQWEYACRAGTPYRYQLGDSLEDLSRVAWHRDNISSLSTQDVGQKEPNNWGLYDMLGNVMEWCFDSPVEYPNGTTQMDWFGGSEEGIRNLRGGSILVRPVNSITCSGRMYSLTDPYIVSGFRLCLRYETLRTPKDETTALNFGREL
jgi:formylglycine-generating enzyme required for sulfatase activity